MMDAATRFIAELRVNSLVVADDLHVRDSYKVTNKLTMDLGLTWDYLPPFHELRNRWTYLNPLI